VRITIKNLQKKIPVSQKRIKKLINKTLSSEGAKHPGEINVIFVNDKIIKKLNRHYLKHKNTTDVLAFDMPEENTGRLLADIAISTDEAIRNSRIYKTTPLYELYFYIVHGVLHILGYDDSNSRTKNAMYKKQENILKTCPYIKPKV